MKLNTLSSLPIDLLPSSGMIAAFDTRVARKLLHHIDEQTVRINEAMAKANACAAMMGAILII